MLVALLVASTALFAVGVTAERSDSDTHVDVTTPQAEATGTEQEGAHDESGESGETEAGEAHSETASGETDPEDERVLGVDLESTPLLVLAVLAGLGLAGLTATRLGAPARLPARSNGDRAGLGGPRCPRGRPSVRRVAHRRSVARDQRRGPASRRRRRQRPPRPANRGAGAMKRLIAPLILLAAVGIALVLTNGGGRVTGDAQTAGPVVPAVSVARLDGDGAFALGELASAKSPTLLWFWAPWCEVCNHEAPAIERLAADAGGELAVVAIGGPRPGCQRSRVRRPAPAAQPDRVV